MKKEAGHEILFKCIQVIICMFLFNVSYGSGGGGGDENSGVTSETQRLA